MKFLFPFILILLANCSDIPSNKLFSFYYSATYSVQNDTLSIKLTNTLKCPLHFKAFSDNQTIQDVLDISFPMVLATESDTILYYNIHVSDKDFKVRFTGTRGNPAIKADLKKISLPFQNGKTYKINQGYNGAFSHQGKYAIDFGLRVGDTICSVADGYVVGVIQDYKKGGSSSKWRGYANEITIFHPNMNAFSQYAHIDFNGSLVTNGDIVQVGQPIGISGMTGYTAGPHLHFGVFSVTEENNFNLLKTEFCEGYIGEELIKGMSVKKNAYNKRW